LKRIKKIVVKTIPKSTGEAVKPCIEIYDGKMKNKTFELLWTNNPKHKQHSKVPLNTYKASKDTEMVIEIINTEDPNHGVQVCGDLYFKLINSKNNDLICRFAINTSFVLQNTNVYTLYKRGVDPDSILKNKNFDNSFQIDIHFEDVCA
jgi:hypothetical protein